MQRLMLWVNLCFCSFMFSSSKLLNSCVQFFFLFYMIAECKLENPNNLNDLSIMGTIMVYIHEEKIKIINENKHTKHNPLLGLILILVDYICFLNTLFPNTNIWISFSLTWKLYYYLFMVNIIYCFEWEQTSRISMTSKGLSLVTLKL